MIKQIPTEDAARLALELGSLYKDYGGAAAELIGIDMRSLPVSALMLLKEACAEALHARNYSARCDCPVALHGLGNHSSDCAAQQTRIIS